MIAVQPHARADLVYLLANHWRRILAVTVIAFVLACAGNAVFGARYTATARVLVQAGAGAPHSAGTEAEILRDPALIRALVPGLQASLPPPGGWSARAASRLGKWWRAQTVRFGLAAPQTQDQHLAARLTGALAVSVVADTDVVALRLTWTDPGFAATALNAILRAQQHAASASVQAGQNLALAQTRLRDAQTASSRLGPRNAADPGAIEREKDRIAARLAASQSTANAVQLERDQTAQRLDAAEKAYAGGGWVDNPDAPAAAAGAPALDQAFIDLMEQRQALLGHQPPDDKRVKAIDQQIAQARQRAYDQSRHVLGARLKTLDTRLAALATRDAADEVALRALDDRLVEAEALHDSQQAADGVVADAARQADAVQRAAGAARNAGLQVLGDAVPPVAPDWPAPVLLLIAATLAGFAASLASAIQAERSRLTIDRPSDIARLLQIPVLASVPELR